MMFLFAIAGYLFGSIPFGLVLARLAGHGDIRKIGSGNIGATNVLRTGSKKLALATLILDCGKGAAAIFLYMAFWYSMASAGEETVFSRSELSLIGLAAVIGHMYPVWLKFKGGKGVATALGMLLAAAPYVGLACCAIWLATALVTRISSLSALIAMLAAPFAARFIYDDAGLAAICGLLALLIWFKHRENIRRLIKGIEPKIGKKKDNKNAIAEK